MATPAPRTPAWGSDLSTRVAVVATVAALWFAAKMLTAWAWVLMPGEYGDTYYYFTTAKDLAAFGGPLPFDEYPTPAAWLLLLPWQLGFRGYVTYRAAVMVFMAVADAVFSIVLGRRLGPRAVLAWIAATTVLGQLAMLRFDLLPAIVAGAAVLYAGLGRRTTAGVLIAVGTALKVWPIVLLPILLRRRPDAASVGNLRPLLAVAATGLALVVASVAGAGWARLLSPLSYQSHRGLQIEAVAATIPMLTWANDPNHSVFFSSFKAYELMGPSVDLWLRVASAMSVVGAVSCLALLVWWWRQGTRPAAIGWIALTLVGTFVVTSRALSPQYMLWLAAPTVVLLGLALLGRPDAPPLIPALATFVGLVVLSLLTTGIYPVHYSAITARMGQTPTALALLTARNIGLLVFLAWCAACAVVTSRRGAHEPRQP